MQKRPAGDIPAGLAVEPSSPKRKQASKGALAGPCGGDTRAARPAAIRHRDRSVGRPRGAVRAQPAPRRARSAPSAESLRSSGA